MTPAHKNIEAAREAFDVAHLAHMAALRKWNNWLDRFVLSGGAAVGAHVIDDFEILRDAEIEPLHRSYLDADEALARALLQVGHQKEQPHGRC